MIKYERDRCHSILGEASTYQNEVTAEAAADPLKRDLDEAGGWTNSGLDFGEEPLPRSIWCMEILSNLGWYARIQTWKRSQTQGDMSFFVEAIDIQNEGAELTRNTNMPTHTSKVYPPRWAFSPAPSVQKNKLLFALKIKTIQPNLRKTMNVAGRARVNKAVQICWEVRRLIYSKQAWLRELGAELHIFLLYQILYLLAHHHTPSSLIAY